MWDFDKEAEQDIMSSNTTAKTPLWVMTQSEDEEDGVDCWKDDVDSAVEGTNKCRPEPDGDEL